MRIAGAIIALFCALIILVQSLAAGTANAIEAQGSNDGSVGFFVAVLFVVGAALMFGKVMKGALWVWAATSVIAIAGAATGKYFGDLYAWGTLAAIYAFGSYLAVRKRSRVAAEAAPAA